MTDTTDATTARQVASDLRAMRARAGLTRAQVSSLAGCSLSTLGAFEAGAIPKHSVVLERVLQVLEQHETREAA